MKLKTIFTLNQKGSPKALYQVICSVVPSAVRVDDVRIEASSGEKLLHAKIAALVGLCKAAGLKRSKLGKIGTYGYVIMREYEPEDLTPCEFVFVHGLSGLTIQWEDKRDKGGKLILLAKNASQLGGVGEVNHTIVVSGEVRVALESESFRGLVFCEVGIYGRKGGEPVEPCWELATTITLPKIANTDRLKCYGTGPTGQVEPFTGDYSRMIFIDDPPYAGGEVHYRRRDLKCLGQFDIAQTFENLWIPQKSFVISQRFYQHCLKHKIPLAVVPVRIDPD